MIGVIQDWLFHKVGLNFNLQNLEQSNVFQDGCVFINIFQKYGVLNSNFALSVSKESEHERSYRNLKTLKPIFDMLKIKYDDKIMFDVLNNKHLSILKLLYDLYVCLENKQNLYFISEQNYDKIQASFTNCFDDQANPIISVQSVNQTTSKELLKEHTYSEKLLVENKDIIEWYKSKQKSAKHNLNLILNQTKDTFRDVPQREVIKSLPRTKQCPCRCSFSESKRLSENITSLPDVDVFLNPSRHGNLLSYDQFITVFKDKQRHRLTKMGLETSIQDDLLQKTWSKIVAKQNEVFNCIFSGIMLKQSQYEKQLLTKLIQTQQQMKIQRENEIQANKRIFTEDEKLINCDLQIKEEFEELQKNYENEKNRAKQLHRKLYKEKQDFIKKQHYSLCQDIMDSFIDLAVSSSKYQSHYSVPVPQPLWNSWKQLFFKSQPIVIPFQQLESEALECGIIDYDEVINFEKQYSEILDENDVDEYLYTCGQWFHERMCIENGNVDESVLAFVVNRLLTLKYPKPLGPLPAELPSFSTQGILLNLTSSESIEKLRILLSQPSIHVFEPENAIQKCIDSFLKETQQSEEKTEAKNKVSKPSKEKDKKKPAGPKKVTDNKDKKSVKEGKNKGGKKKANLKKELITSIDQNKPEEIFILIDKETQTSFVNENGQGVKRTPLGIIGEEVFNILKDGNKIDDFLLVNVVVEYLKTLEDSKGWVLLNYPLTINQASIIELALSGTHLPIEKYISEEEEFICHKYERDENEDKRKSKLFPSTPTYNDLAFKTDFTFFIKVKQKSDNVFETQSKISLNDSLLKTDTISRPTEEETYEDQKTKEILPDLVEQCYTDQLIYKNFEYESLDLANLKKLARLILQEDMEDAANSVDLFGEESLKKLTVDKKKGKKETTKKKAGEKESKKAKKKKDKIMASQAITIDQEEFPQDKVQSVEMEPDKSVPKAESLLKVMSPGGEDWQFVSSPIAHEIALVLATIWENIENCYLQNLKDIFFENRIISLRLAPYCSYIQETVEQVANKSDIRQDLVNVFKNYYMGLTSNLRALPEVKSQLFCKILEMQQNLWQIVDQKKNEIESKRIEIIKQNWLVNEMCMLVNNFLSLVQTEYDRSLETLKLISDYYLSMLDKTPIPNSKLSGIKVSKITAQDLIFESQEILNKSKIASRSPSVISLSRQSNFIIRSLVDCYEREKDLDLLNIILLNEIEEAKKRLQVVANVFYSQIKNETDLTVDSKKPASNKSKKSDKDKSTKPDTKKKKKEKISTTLNSEQPHKSSDIKNSFQKPENNSWSVNEHFRKHLLLKEWKFVVDKELERFKFRLELINLRAQEVIMESYCYVESVFCEMHRSNLSKYDSDIENINKLCDYLRTAIEEEYSLDNTIILKKNELFIDISNDSNSKKNGCSVKELLEETNDFYFTINQLKKLMVIFKIANPYGVIRKQALCYILQDLTFFNSDDNQPRLPKMWNLLSELQLKTVTDNIFGPEYVVHWRDFIIYNLNIPYPGVDDILKLRKNFLCLDKEHSEIVSFSDYEKVTLWFEEDVPLNPEEGLRFALIKQLLFELFRVDEDKVNYTALLLYFCKDFDPALGLRKALCLSLGKNVITSKTELDELLEDEMETRKSILNLLDNIINTIVHIKEGVLIYEVSGSMAELHFNLDKTSLDYTVSEQSDIDVNDSTENGPTSDESHDFKYKSESENEHRRSSALRFIPEIQVMDRLWVSRIPIKTVIDVFNASFIHQDKNFSLRAQYLNCLEDEADGEGMIEAHVLMELCCIKSLFELTNKFKISLPCDILIKCLAIS